MATPIDPPTIPPSPAVPTLSNKRKRSFSNVDNGIATPPKSPKVLSSFSGQYLKREENSLLPSPPNSIQASPEPPTLESSATLVTFIQDLKDGKTLSKFETSFSIEAEELERFEEAVGRNKVLSGYYRKRLRYEWDPTSCVFTILKASAETEGICSRISQCLEKQLRELADAGFTLKGLDSWERKRVKELADLIRPLPLRRLDIGGFRMSPDLCFTFGTTESLLGMAHRLVEPLVVFEVRCAKFLLGREVMEGRARRYLEVSGQQCPFKHRVKTVVLVHYSHQGREVQMTVTRLAYGIITTKFVDSSCQGQPGHMILSLSDFLPHDAIDLGFMQDKIDRRACDGIELRINIDEVVRQSTKREIFGYRLQYSKRRRVESFDDAKRELMTWLD
ncbi:hypothetical protein Vi05172_g6961 [Venturia inaequalis]|nr:hypothetical protein Vi05172_g6961 [Venturia inaequalis]